MSFSPAKSVQTLLPYQLASATAAPTRRLAVLLCLALASAAWTCATSAPCGAQDIPDQSHPAAAAGPGPSNQPSAARPLAPGYQSAGTRKMAELLARIFHDNDWKADPNKPAERAAYYRTLLTRKLSMPDDFQVRLEMGRELLRSGDSSAAVQTIEELRQLCRQHAFTPSDEATHQLGEWLGLSYLRLGEQENCNQMHGQRSCIFPIKGSGIHHLTRGAEGAVREFSSLLAANANDDQARWLLNVAYMQLGRYPRDVPKAWLIPDSLFRSEQEIPEFADIASTAGVDVTGHAGGAIVEDFDGDGLLDILVTSSGPLDQMHLFHNQGHGAFEDVTGRSGLIGETGGLNAVSTDYNNDGHPDVLVLRGGWWNKFGRYPMSLLRNNGNGTFDDVTERAGLMSAHPTQAAAWADFDNDGWLDLFVAHESSPDEQNSCQLFHNNHDGTFTDIAPLSGLDKCGFVKGVAWGDFNNDGRPDLYVSVLNGRNRLFRNDGPATTSAATPGAWKFTDVTAKAGVDHQTHSFATWFFDYDNDGWPDIFSAGYSTESARDVGTFEMGKLTTAETPRLYHNNHDGTFTDVTHAVHLDRAILTMGANFGDLDNDGFLDIYLGTGDSTYQALLPNRMFRNDDGNSFHDVTTAGGFGHLQKGHAIAFADLENTGYEDVFEEMGGALPGDTFQSALYHNPLRGNHSITLVLEGVKTNRPAFGARLEVTISESGRPRHIYRTVGYGSSFGGNPFRQHIGLGKAQKVEEIKVFWPTSGTTQEFRNLPADQAFKVKEGDLAPTPFGIAAHAMALQKN